MPLCDTDTIRMLDRLTIESGTPGLTLMERAAQGLFKAAVHMLPDKPNAKILIVCGKGNNGGDGLAVTRLLFNAGYEAKALLLFDRSEYRGDARTNLEKLEHGFVPILVKQWPAPDKFDLLVDAVVGTRFKGKPEGVVSQAIRRINASGIPVLAADIPSGIESDTGNVPDEAVKAVLTVTFGLPKAGLYFYPARSLTGTIRTQDIGLDPNLVEKHCHTTLLTDNPEARKGLVLRTGTEHKNSCGRVLVVAGSKGLTGAAVLSAEAALKSGAGVVTLCVPESLNSIFEIKLTEEMTLPLPDQKKGYLAATHARTILKQAESYDIMLLGPGMGRNSSTQSLIRTLVLKSPIPVVLDADGINAFEGRAKELSKAKSSVIITPHEGELKRLSGGKSIPKGGMERIEYVRKQAKAFGVTLLLKGAPTLVSNGVRVHLNPTGNPGMATAGAGDVLTGIIAGLVAQSGTMESAAVTGAWLHGRAGDFAAADLTGYCLTATDLIHYMPKAFKELLP